MHLRQVKVHFLPLSFSFSHLKARENVGCGVLVVCSIHAHVQHLMHLRQSDLHVFNFYFPCPTSRFGKMKLWGGGIGCQIQSLQFYSPHFLPQNSGKCNSRAGVSYLCKITTSRAPAASQITCSSSVVFLFPPQNSRKCRCGVLVVCSIHAHAQHLMHLRQSALRVFSFFPCSTSRFGKTKLWVGGVIFVQNYNISCTCGKSNCMFFLCRFPFPTSKLEKM